MTTPNTLQANDPALVEPAFARILCAVDGTEASLAAVEQAAILAGPRGALSLLAVTAESGSGKFHGAAIAPARAQRILDHASQIAAARGTTRCTQEIDPAEPPGDVIVARAAAHDLLALGAPATTHLTELLVGGIAAEVLRRRPCSVLFSRPVRAEGEFPGRLVVASDGSEESDEVIRVAVGILAGRGSGVVLVHSDRHADAGAADRIEEQGAALTAATTGSCEVRVAPGPAPESILEATRRPDTSLVVMGSRTRRGIRAVGGVSTHVVHEAPCSVLLVPPTAG